MTDEITPEDAAALSLVPDAKVFDLKAALAGVTHPTKSVPVFLDETLAFGLKQANEAALRDPNNQELEDKRNELVEQFKALTLTFNLQGVPRHVRVAVEKRVDETNPAPVNIFGTVLHDATRSDLLTEALWSVYIQSVVAADGSVAIMSPEDIHEFRRMAPEASVDAVTAGIRSLIDDSEKGYELGVQELNFLSQPSQGA